MEPGSAHTINTYLIIYMNRTNVLPKGSLEKLNVLNLMSKLNVMSSRLHNVNFWLILRSEILLHTANPLILG